jgi:hypothetical protein
VLDKQVFEWVNFFWLKISEKVLEKENRANVQSLYAGKFVLNSFILTQGNFLSLL